MLGDIFSPFILSDVALEQGANTMDLSQMAAYSIYSAILLYDVHPWSLVRSSALNRE